MNPVNIMDVRYQNQDAEEDTDLRQLDETQCCLEHLAEFSPQPWFDYAVGEFVD